MGAPFERINFPELFFGFVAPIGVDLRPILNGFAQYFYDNDYNTIEIKVTDVYDKLKTKLIPKDELRPSPRYERFISYIKYGNQIRAHFGDDQISCHHIR